MKIKSVFKKLKKKKSGYDGVLKDDTQTSTFTVESAEMGTSKPKKKSASKTGSSQQQTVQKTSADNNAGGAAAAGIQTLPVFLEMEPETKYPYADAVVPPKQKKEKYFTPEKSTSNEYALGVAFWSFILFTATQMVFAVIAKSEAMMADSQAMFVDALTYLFNLIAERLKRRSFSEEEVNSMHPKLLAYRRERLRLYLELVPPLISATILMVVTFSATQTALMSLSRPVYNDTVNVNLMLMFSFGSLLLDVLNIGCFANAHQAYGIGEVEKEEVLYTTSKDGVYDLCDIEEGQSTAETKPKLTLNLNMNSAYTHVMADTLRTVAELIAAFIAFCFDSVQGTVADSLATLVVSVIILFSLLPLLHGLLATVRRIIDLRADFPVIGV